MKVLCASFIVFIVAGILFFHTVDKAEKNRQMEQISEASILENLDNSIVGDYNDFINLGHGYFELANSRLTLFKDSNEWALVFEKFGYNARSGHPVLLETYFFGNCLKNLDEYNGQSSNYHTVEVENNISDVLQKHGDTITIRGQKVKVPVDLAAYQKYGIDWDYEGRNYEGAVLKYLAETYPELTRATNAEVRRCLPNNLEKIMTIDNWYQEEYHQFEPTIPPSKQQTFQMVAKILVTGDTTYYRPTHKSNTHWSDWPESGGL